MDNIRNLIITEDYVSFEVAKLLDEKGFEQRNCQHSYNSKGVFGWSDDLDPYEYLAPTLQMACKWLRKKHNILLFLLPAQENGKLVYLVEVWTWNEEEGIYESTYAPMPRKEPEQAVDAALKYALENLI